MQSYGFQVGIETLDLHDIHPAVFPVLIFLKSTPQADIPTNPDAQDVGKDKLWAFLACKIRLRVWPLQFCLQHHNF